MMNIIILLLLLSARWIFRIAVNWYFLTAGILLSAIPLLLHWGSIGVAVADYVAQAVYFLLVAALIITIFPLRKGSESALSVRGFSWIAQHFPLAIGGFGLWVVLNYFLPTPPSIIFVIVIGGFFFKVKKEIFIIAIVLFIVGILIMRGVLHNVPYADKLGVWLFYSIVGWTIYLIRDHSRYRSSN